MMTTSKFLLCHGDPGKIAVGYDGGDAFVHQENSGQLTISRSCLSVDGMHLRPVESRLGRSTEIRENLFVP